MMVLINGGCAMRYCLFTISARGKTTETWLHVFSYVGNVRYPLVMLMMVCDGFLFLFGSQHSRSILRLLCNLVSQGRTGFTPLKASSFAFVNYYDCYNLTRARGDHYPLVMHMPILNIMSAIPSFDQTVEYHSRTPCKHDTSGLRRLSNRDIVQHPDKC